MIRFPEMVEAIVSKANKTWTREDFNTVKDYLSEVPDRYMTNRHVDLLFRIGDIEDRLIEEANNE